MSALFECDLAVVDDLATIVCRGEFAVGACDPVFDAIARTGPAVRIVVFDLGQVSFIDATGIRALLAARELVEDHGGRVVLRDLSPMALHVLDVLGLDETFVCEFSENA